MAFCATVRKQYKQLQDFTTAFTNNKLQLLLPKKILSYNRKGSEQKNKLKIQETYFLMLYANRYHLSNSLYFSTFNILHLLFLQQLFNYSPVLKCLRGIYRDHILDEIIISLKASSETLKGVILLKTQYNRHIYICVMKTAYLTCY